MMKFIGMPFSPLMMRSLVEYKNKTETRRLFSDKLQISVTPDEFVFKNIINSYDHTETFKTTNAYFIDKESRIDYGLMKCRYGNAGDIIWCREKHRLVEHEIFMGEKVCQYADGTILFPTNLEDPNRLKPLTEWKPSIHFPKKYCRVFLKIKSIGVERLKDISVESALAEGILHSGNGFQNYNKNIPFCFEDPRDSYFSLFESLHGKEIIDLNPWVWVIKFETIIKDKSKWIDEFYSYIDNTLNINGEKE